MTMTVESGTVNYVQGFLNDVSGRLRTFKGSAIGFEKGASDTRWSRLLVRELGDVVAELVAKA